MMPSKGLVKLLSGSIWTLSGPIRNAPKFLLRNPISRASVHKPTRFHEVHNKAIVPFFSSSYQPFSRKEIKKSPHVRESGYPSTARRDPFSFRLREAERVPGQSQKLKTNDPRRVPSHATHVLLGERSSYLREGKNMVSRTLAARDASKRLGRGLCMVH